MCGRVAGPGAGGRLRGGTRSVATETEAGAALPGRASPPAPVGAPELETAAQPQVRPSAPSSVALGATASSHPAGPAGASGERRAAPPPLLLHPKGGDSLLQAQSHPTVRPPGARPQTQRSHSRPRTQETVWGHTEMLIM